MMMPSKSDKLVSSNVPAQPNEHLQKLQNLMHYLEVLLLEVQINLPHPHRILFLPFVSLCSLLSCHSFLSSNLIFSYKKTNLSYMSKTWNMQLTSSSVKCTVPAQTGPSSGKFGVYHIWGSLKWKLDKNIYPPFKTNAQAQICKAHSKQRQIYTWNNMLKSQSPRLAFWIWHFKCHFSAAPRAFINLILQCRTVFLDKKVVHLMGQCPIHLLQVKWKQSNHRKHTYPFST